ncbi:cadmium-translocating P-type ATPase [Rhodobacteraceae bacterium 2CG4]|uniref:Cadmium-translocating P-type ATPase n=1 Tax=Halovulum marinum TaxID=2662447 RepID=A0A6L5YZA0_9RHOB|nr:heavy metal translocating P-type ATPase [Halovulum marinum]MSU89603.1 cadmium-translocating P-type ATPase [Halovulum marinum]
MSVAACPAAAAAAPAPRPAAAASGATLQIAVPSVHCAGCIATVEHGLAGLEGVVAARVNLTLRRLAITARPGAQVEAAVLARLQALGHPGRVLDAATLGRAADPAGRALLLRLGVAGFGAMNVMLLSVAVWAGAEGVTRDFLHWVSALIALPAALFAAQPFFVNAWAALRVGRLVMDTPISLAILLSLAVSLYETALGGAHAYFDAAMSLTFFLLLGRVLDHRSRAAARSAAAELAALEVPRAELLGKGGACTVPVAELAVGDVVLVRPGMRVPTDGIIRSGATELDRSLLTGETAPVAAAAGQAVHAGEVNLTGRLEVRVTAAGADSTLRRIADLVREAEGARNRYVSLADRAARVYAPVVHLLALVSGLGWYWASGDARLSINIAVAVLIITCPCALGLAVPSVMVAASGALFRSGVLLKDGTALERLAGVDTVVLDKTGTLTEGAPVLADPEAVPAGALAVAGALGAGSAHPLARALAAAADAAALDLPRIEAVREVPGQGVEGRLDGQAVRLGRAQWVETGDAETTATWLRVGNAPPVGFRFADRPRPGLADMLEGLRGKRVMLLSGDAPVPVARLAARFGIDAAEAGLTPEDKADRVSSLRAAGARVLMLGDGMNDTAALAAADVSISPASGMDVARNAADIVLLTPDLSVVPRVIRLAGSARSRMLENFALAAAYNAVAIPLAVAGYATPLAAALAMSGSSICVSLNALRVRRGMNQGG